MVAGNEKLFLEIKLLILTWYMEIQTRFIDKPLNTKVLHNEKDCFVVSFDNGTAMAELVVEQAMNTPYRFVSFEVAEAEFNQVYISYSFFDNESLSKNEIIEQLNKGIEYFIN